MNRLRLALDQAALGKLIPRGSSVLLAVSGGADSMALLHAAAEAASDTDWRLFVAHVHHGWRGREADRDLRFVEDRARRLGLPFASRHRDARAVSRDLGLSPEAGARHVRYEALREMAGEAGAERIATAHQEDDVLESHLLAKARRGGLALLAGPRQSRQDGVVRPLLSVPRTEVLRYLAERGIPFRRDASNGDLRLSRNRIRRELSDLGAAERARLLENVARLRDERDRLERELSERVLPRVRSVPGAAFVEAEFLTGLPAELLRAALEKMAAAFARPGRPPTTGREREQILDRLAAGGDFRFEAGRRIRFERRGALFSVRPAPPGPAAAVYHLPIDSSAVSETAS
jgi:tRNA(Ile)-lysidine synthetase-like protein